MRIRKNQYVFKLQRIIIVMIIFMHDVAYQCCIALWLLLLVLLLAFSLLFVLLLLLLLCWCVTLCIIVASYYSNDNDDYYYYYYEFDAWHHMYCFAGIGSANRCIIFEFIVDSYQRIIFTIVIMMRDVFFVFFCVVSPFGVSCLVVVNCWQCSFWCFYVVVVVLCVVVWFSLWLSIFSLSFLCFSSLFLN